MPMIPDFATNLIHIKVLGSVSVERVSQVGPINGSHGFMVYVLLGPIGSGKSSFIEAVASNTSLGLSSDKLEGFTQSVSIYRIINVVRRREGDVPIYLVDVPGFADSKLSAMSIVSMLKNMIQTNPKLLFFRILYHTPINTPRFPGSLRIFEALTGPQSAPYITIVSTMWDLVWNENARRRAEGNFSQLRDKIWKDYVAQGANIVKFHNTHESALTILDDRAYGQRTWIAFRVQQSIFLPLRETPFASHIYNDLQIRIHDLQMQQASIQSELQMATERSDKKLEAILIRQLEDVRTLFTKFEEGLRELGPPAEPPVTLEPVGQTYDPAAPTARPLRIRELTATSIPEPVASPPAARLQKDRIFTRATNTLKRWGKKLSKHRASD